MPDLRQQAHDRQGRDALAAPELADDAQRLPAHERKAHASDGLGQAAAVTFEGDVQVVDSQQRGGGHSYPSRIDAAISSSISRPVDEAGWPVPARHLPPEVHPALSGHLFQAGKLAQWIGVVVHPEIVEGVVLAVMDQQRGGLLAALVAARGLAGQHRRYEAPRERQGRFGLVDPDGFGEYGRPRQHVAGHGERLAHLVAAPVDACGSGVACKPACTIHHVQLAVVTAFVRLGELVDRLLGTAPGAEQPEALVPIVRVDEGLGGDGTGTGLDVGDQRPHGKEAGRHDDADASGALVTGDDRPSHACCPKPMRWLEMQSRIGGSVNDCFRAHAAVN